VSNHPPKAGSLLPEERPEFVNALVDPRDLPADYLLPGEPTPELVDSIRNLGMLQPIGLVEAPPGDPGARYRVIWGRRRLKAARAVGLEQIAARIYPPGTPGEVMGIAENQIRAANIASDLLALIHLYGQQPPPTDPQVKAATGLDSSRLRFLRKFLGTGFNADLKSALLNGKLSQNLAEACVRRPLAEQAQLAAILKDQGKLTYKDLETVRSAAVQSAGSLLPDSVFTTPDADEEEAGREQEAVDIPAPVPVPGVDPGAVDPWHSAHPLEEFGTLCQGVDALFTGHVEGRRSQDLAENLDTERLEYLWSQLRRATSVQLPAVLELLAREIARRRDEVLFPAQAEE
jgi:ParB-like chromosome segregation protein Spo0J